MPKKRSNAQKQRDEGKTRLELRLDDDLYASIKEAAESTGISANQLMQGIARWAMQHVHPGEETHRDEQGQLVPVNQQGCVWFGKKPEPFKWTDEHSGEEGIGYRPGSVFFSLDFTERHVVREPDYPSGDEGAGS